MYYLFDSLGRIHPFTCPLIALVVRESIQHVGLNVSRVIYCAGGAA